MKDLKQKIQAAVNLYKSGNFIKCQEITKKLIELVNGHLEKMFIIIMLGFILLVAIQLIIGGLVDLDILSINEEFKKYF